jgi:hypothetical protein
MYDKVSPCRLDLLDVPWLFTSFPDFIQMLLVSAKYYLPFAVATAFLDVLHCLTTVPTATIELMLLLLSRFLSAFGSLRLNFVRLFQFLSGWIIPFAFSAIRCT